MISVKTMIARECEKKSSWTKYSLHRVKIMKTRDLPLLQNNRAGAHPASQFSGYCCSSLGIKWQEHDIYHSFLSGLKLRMNGGMSLLPHIPSWCGQGLYLPFTLRLVFGKSTNIRTGTPPQNVSWKC